MKPAKETLQEPLRQAAAACSLGGDRARLDAPLSEALQDLPHCKFLYAMNTGLRALRLMDEMFYLRGQAEYLQRHGRPYLLVRRLPLRGLRRISQNGSRLLARQRVTQA